VGRMAKSPGQASVELRVVPGPLTSHQSLVNEWEYTLRAENKSTGTVDSYTLSMRMLLDFTNGELPTRYQIRAFLGDQFQRNSASTVATRHWGLKSFFDWLVAEDVIEKSPMKGMKEPAVPEVETHVLTDDELRRVLATCRGRGFYEVRDLAILRVFISSGCRLEELTALKVGDLDLPAATAHVTGKGRRDRRVGLGVKAVTALGRYLRARERHRYGDLPYLWLGNSGPLSKHGVYGMVKRRGARAGVELHPHSFRHTMSHNWLDAAGNEHDLMRLMGWT
jgi:integrase/recombinase XerC